MMRFNPSRLVERRIMMTCMLVTVALAAGSCSGSGPRDEPAVASLPHLPTGYALRLDRPNRDPSEFLTTSDDGGLHIRTGPAGIIYRPDQVVDEARYVARARFTEIDAPIGHREGFGLFIGGLDLENDNQRYTYFLIRGDGRYLIKRRYGDSTEEITNGWESSEEVHVPTSENRDVANELAITVDGEHLRFSCNGELVADMPIGSLSTQGVVGVRVNHNLEVRVEDLSVDGS